MAAWIHPRKSIFKSVLAKTTGWSHSKSGCHNVIFHTTIIVDNIVDI